MFFIYKTIIFIISRKMVLLDFNQKSHIGDTHHLVLFNSISILKYYTLNHREIYGY
jgi:hypothetical protein